MPGTHDVVELRIGPHGARAPFPDAPPSALDIFALRMRVAELEAEVLNLRHHLTERQQPTPQAPRPQRPDQGASTSDGERDPTHGQLSKGHAKRVAEVRTMWCVLGEDAALKGWAPPFLRAVHKTQATYDWALGHEVADVIGRTGTVLRREGDQLTGQCPLCDRDGLHAHPPHRTWGCRACGRFGDPHGFAVEWRRLRGGKGRGNGRI